MVKLILNTDKGAIQINEDTFVVALDETGHEEFKDPNYQVFGIGGCAFMARDYQRLIETPWNFVCSRFFPDQERPMHASEMTFSKEQIGALNHFFKNFPFFRVATTVSINTCNETEYNYIDIIGRSILERINHVAKYTDFKRLIIIYESSERIEHKVLSSLSRYKITEDDIDISIELGLMPKSLCFSALEVADFIIHTAGAHTRAIIDGNKKYRKDFEIIFSNVDEKLQSFFCITDVEYKNN